MRPKLGEHFIREAKLRKLAEAAVDVYEDIDACYSSPCSANSVQRQSARRRVNQVLSPGELWGWGSE